MNNYQPLTNKSDFPATMNPSPSPSPAAMAASSTFHERLLQMEETRNQRLSLLQAEKELMIERSQLLRDNISNIRSMEQRCLLLEKQNADLGFQILAKNDEIDATDAKYQASAKELRVLKGELDDVEFREKELDRFYEAKRMEIEEFKEQVRRRVVEVRLVVESMRSAITELSFNLKDLQANDGYTNNSEIAVAEKRKAELLAIKEDLDRNLAFNYRLRSLLQKQLQKSLVLQVREGELANPTKNK